MNLIAPGTDDDLPDDLVDERHPHLSKAKLDRHAARPPDHRLTSFSPRYRTDCRGALLPNNLDRPRPKTFLRAGKTVRRHRLLFCHLCGSQFGTSSLRIHWKSCQQKFRSCQQSLPKSKRVELPAPPDGEEFPVPGPTSKDVEFECWNKEALRIFGVLTEEQRESQERKRRSAAVLVLQRGWRAAIAKEELTQRRVAKETRRLAHERERARVVARRWGLVRRLVERKTAAWTRWRGVQAHVHKLGVRKVSEFSVRVFNGLLHPNNTTERPNVPQAMHRLSELQHQLSKDARGEANEALGCGYRLVREGEGANSLLWNHAYTATDHNQYF